MNVYNCEGSCGSRLIQDYCHLTPGPHEGDGYYSAVVGLREVCEGYLGYNTLGPLIASDGVLILYDWI